MPRYRHKTDEVLHHDDQRAEIQFAIRRAVVRLENAVLGEFEKQYAEAELEGRQEEYVIDRAQIYSLMHGALIRLSGRAITGGGNV